MMATAHDEKPAESQTSDTERDPGLKNSPIAAGFEDPDEGLSEEERAAIVRRISSLANHLCLSKMVYQRAY